VRSKDDAFGKGDVATVVAALDFQQYTDTRQWVDAGKT